MLAWKTAELLVLGRATRGGARIALPSGARASSRASSSLIDAM
jgi:hypothetical protein